MSDRENTAARRDILHGHGLRSFSVEDLDQLQEVVGNELLARRVVACGRDGHGWRVVHGRLCVRWPDWFQVEVCWPCGGARLIRDEAETPSSAPKLVSVVNHKSVTRHLVREVLEPASPEVPRFITACGWTTVVEYAPYEIRRCGWWHRTNDLELLHQWQQCTICARARIEIQDQCQEVAPLAFAELQRAAELCKP